MDRKRQPLNPFGLPNIVIPAEIIFNERLTWREKGLFGIIANLASNTRGYCWASNQYLAKLVNVRPDTVSSMVSRLQEHGYIIVEVESGVSRKILVDYTYPQRHAGLLQRALVDVRAENEDTPSGLSPNGVGLKPKGYRALAQTYIDRRDSNSVLSNNSSNDSLTSNTLRELTPNPPATGLLDERDTSSPVDAERVVQLYTELCPSLPQVRKLTEQRKKTIRTRLKDYPLATMKEAFKKAEASDFLSGRSGDWNGCNLDWLMNENNLVKVLEGKYTNGTNGGNRPVREMKTIDDVFTSNTLKKAFARDCVRPAMDLFDIDEAELTDALLTLHDQIESGQAGLSQDLRQLMPSPLSLVSLYVSWVKDTDWITDTRVNILDIDHALFTRFRRQQAKEDNQERDPISGKSYVRG